MKTANCGAVFHLEKRFGNRFEFQHPSEKRSV